VHGDRILGICPDILSELTESMDFKSVCLTFDGKKLKQGLWENSGDVDLLGFESDKTLDDKKVSLQQALDSVNDMIYKLDDLSDEEWGRCSRFVQGRVEVITT
jgi:hypothetical protein